MRSLWGIFGLALILAGCQTSDGTPIVSDGGLIGTVSEWANPGSTYKRREAEDDARCQKFGFGPGTQGYGACRLERDRLRASQQPQIVVVR